MYITKTNFRLRETLFLKYLIDKNNNKFLNKDSK